MSDQATLEADAAPPEPSRPRRRVRLLGGLAGALLVIAGALVAFVVARGGSGGNEEAKTTIPAAWERPAVSAAGLVQRRGVKIAQVAVTGDGGLVDLRFTVVDPNKAAAIHDPATPPAVVDQRGGLVVHELFMGHQHSAPFKSAVTYYLVFNNPGNWVHRGDRVAVLLGDAQVENVTVQ